MIDFENILNPQQLAACTHETGPLLILAGAGSGKTRVITHRIAWLILELNVSPDAILAVTFTNKAANEMSERIEQILGPDLLDIQPHIGTFHATGARLLRKYAPRIGLRSGFSIYDDTDQLSMLERCASELFFATERAKLREYRGWIEGWKNQGLDPQHAQEQAVGAEAEARAELYARYQSRMRDANATDFGDLLNLVTWLARDDKFVSRQLRHRWDWILVDEFQDTNPAQYAFLQSLIDPHTQLTVVGDDDQSIYRWRGADVDIMLDFPEHNADTTIVKLEQNYRSSQPILDVASDLIAINDRRLPKRLWTAQEGGEPVDVFVARDERDEARFISRTIRERCVDDTDRFDEVAVFVRINAMLRVLEEQFRADGVPHRIVGATGFYDRAEVKDLLAYLQAIDNPHDVVAFGRILNVPSRGIGKVSQQRLDVAYARFNPPRDDASEAAPDYLSFLRAVIEEQVVVAKSKKLVNALTPLVETLEAAQLLSASGVGPNAVLDLVLSRTDYLTFLRKRSGDRAEVTVENVGELVSAIDEYEQSVPEPTLSAFLQNVNLAPTRADDMLSHTGEVNLMTIHSAKGLEFDNVFVAGMEEDILPYRRRDEEPDVEEERRLCYVAFTRARHRLHLSLASSRRLHGNTRHGRPSRFLDNLQPEHVRWRGAPRVKRGTRPRQSGGGYGWRRPAPPPADDAHNHFIPDYESESQLPDWEREQESRDRVATPQVEPTVVLDLDEEYAQPSAPNPASTGAEFGTGDIVTHKRFGVGEVVGDSTIPGKTLIHVEFPGKGVRKIEARWLKRL